MSRTYLLCVFVAVLTVAGCASPDEMLRDEQGRAVNTAVQRGRFEMNCAEVTGVVLSSNLLEPAAWRGLERAEYTIGVEGCGKRATYVVVCQIGSVNCFAISGSRNAPIER